MSEEKKVHYDGPLLLNLTGSRIPYCNTGRGYVVYVTSDKNKVTCGNCLRLLGEEVEEKT